MVNLQIGTDDAPTVAMSPTCPWSRKRQVWFNAMRDDYWFRLLVGIYDGEDDLVAIPTAELYPLLQTDEKEQNMAAKELLGRGVEESSVLEVQSFRNLASTLPFALRFRLELAIFDNTIIETQQFREPRENPEKCKEELERIARRLVVAFITTVLPPLLKIEWESIPIGNVRGIDVDNFTLTELFAEAITPKLCTIKQRIKDGKS